MINMINKKTTMCLFIILILMMLGVSVVSAEDVTNQTASTEPSTNTVTHQELNMINTQKEVTTSNDEQTHTNTATNTSEKSIKKVASTTENVKSSEAPSTDGYTVCNVSSATEFVRNGTKVYYNLTNDIIFTTSSNGPAFVVNARDDIIINGNGHTISYSGTNNVYFTKLVSNTKYTIYNVVFENFTDSALYNSDAGPGNVNITNCVFQNNKNSRTTNEDGGGGAIMFAQTSLAGGTVNITGTSFINNTANRGGAIFYNDPMNLFIVNCLFANNSAFGSSYVDRNGGGAIYSEDNAVVNIVGTSFVNNTFNRNGVIEQNNIAVRGTGAKVLGYNNDVNGTYITDINSAEYGIYATTQDANAGFHGVVRTTQTHTSFEGENVTINNTVRYALKAIENEYNSSLDGYVLHITFNDTEGNIQTFDRTVDKYGYTYFDYSSDIAGIVKFSVKMDEFYANVLRESGLNRELIYSASTTDETFTIYRINTTTRTSDNQNSYSGKAFTSKNFTINVVDANGNPVTSGNVSLVDAGGVNQTVSVVDGEANFTYNFTHVGNYELSFEYGGTELVYNSSSCTVSVDIVQVQPSFEVDVPDDISVLEPFTVNVSLTNEEGEGIPGQGVSVYVNGEELEGSYITNETGMVPVTYTPSNNGSITIRVVYLGTGDIGSKEFTTTIPGSNIQLMDTVIGVDFNGNATIGEVFVITVNLTGNDELINPSNLTVNLGTDSVDSSMLNYDSDAKLLYITINPNQVVPYNFEINYPGLSGVYKAAESNRFTVNVNLIPVRVFIDYAEVDPESVILMIRFLDPDNQPINEGIFHVNMNNSEAERQDYDTQNLNDLSYKWPVTVDENGTYYVDVGSRFYREDGLPYAFVTFNGTEIYSRSTNRKGEMEVKTDIHVNIYTYNDIELTTRENTFYIGDNVYIYVDLVNNLGFKQNGDVTITIANNRYPDQAYVMPREHPTHDSGLTKIFNNMTSGEYTITVNYLGSGAYNPAEAIKSFTLIKLESNSVVEVKNKTAGNVTLGVKVTDSDDELIKQGKITVEVNGVPRVVEYNLGEGEDEVIINLNDLGIGIRTTDPVDITITYQGDDKYASSEAYDKESVEEGNPTVLSSITPDKGTSIIAVNIEPENVTVGSTLNVYGNLSDLDGSPIIGGNVNVTIKDKEGNIVYSENATTNTRGYYSISELIDQDDYPAGEYRVEVSFADKDHETKTVTQDFNISKVSTNVEVIPLNTTVGNLTVRVMVTDNDGRPIREGTVNITDANGETIKTVELDGTSSYVDVVIDSINTKNPGSLIVNYNGTPMYDDASNTDALSNLELTTRGLNIQANVTNNTYANTTVMVNVTDTTTGNGISGIEFNITNSSGDIVGTGVTGNDGTVTVKVDVPVGADQKLTVVFPDGDDTYTASSKEFTVSVEPREANVTAQLDGTTAGNISVKVTLSDLNGSAITSGTIIIKDNGVIVAEYPFSDVLDGIVDVKTNITDATVPHNLEVTFTGNVNYEDKTITDPALSGFTVDYRTVSITAAQENTTIGNMSFVVNVKDGDEAVSNATVNIIVDDEVIATGVTDEHGNVVIPAELELDTDSVTVQFVGDKTYKEVNKTLEDITFTQRNTNINASLVNKTAGNVTVRVNVTDTTSGEPLKEGSIVILDANDNEVARVPVPIDNTGVIDVTTDILDAGSTSLTVKYEGTPVYKNVTFEDTEGLFTFDVDKRNVTLETNIKDSTFNHTVVEVKVVDEVTGNPVGNAVVTVYADAEHEIPVGSYEVGSNGTATITLNNLPVNAENIYISYEDKDNTYNPVNTTESISISPREVNINATVSNTTAGNITVKVNITDVLTDSPVKMGTFNITSNGKTVATIDLSSDDLVFDDEGLLVVPTNITDVLTYTLNLVYDGTPEYEAETFQLESFTADYKESNLTASIPNHTKGNTTLLVDLIDPVTGEALDGVVYVSIDGAKNREYTVTGGRLEELLDLPVGEHTVTVLYNGNNTYDESTATINLEVEPRNVTIGASFINATQGNVTIKVTAVDNETGQGVNGTVNITLPNGTNVTVTVEDGIGTMVLDLPMNGETAQGVTVTFLEDENYPQTVLDDPMEVTVTKRDSNVTAIPGNTDAGNTSLIVTLRDPVTDKPITSGTIIITDGDEEVARYDFEDETGVVEVLTNITSSGPHNLTVYFTGNINYTDASYTDDNLSKVDIANRTASMTITPVNNTFNDTSIKVTLTDSVTGEGIPGGVVNVYDIDGNTVGTATTDENGTATIKFNVPVDATQVSVNYTGNASNYEPVSETYTFTIEPRSIEVNATVSNTTAGNVTVKVNITDPVTGKPVESGKINITDNKGKVVATVDLENDEIVYDEDGLIIVSTSINETGRTRLTINYDGSPEYDEYSTTTAFIDVTPKESQLTLSIPETTKGNTTVNVTLVDPVTGEKLNGTVTVYVNGTPFDTIDVVNGEGGKLVDLPVGESNVRVVFDGDEKYSPAEDESGEPITVNPREITVKAAIINTTQGNVTIEVNVTDFETGAPINGSVNVTLPDGSNITVPVVNGKAVEVLDIPITGEEVTLNVTYPADGTNKETKITTQPPIMVQPREATVNADIINNKTGEVTVRVNVTDTTTGEPITSGRIIVTDGDKVVYNNTFNTETGIVDVLTNITSSGSHNLIVNFTGNTNYTDKSYTDENLSSLIVEKRTADISITPGNSTVGNTTIVVTLTDSQTGDTLPEGGEVEVYDSENKLVGTGTIGADGRVTIPINVPVNTTNVTVKYLGNDTSYEPISKLYEGFTLEQRDTNVTATVTNTTAGNVTVKLNITDATTGEPLTSGTVNITLNGKVVGNATLPDDIKDGLVEVVVDINSTGNYALVAKYSGDENHTAQSFNIEEFDATPKESNLIAGIPNKVRGNTTLDVKLVDPVTGEGLNGTVYVSVNGSQPGIPVKIINGIPENNPLLDLPVGNSTITVTYDGDKKYDETKIEFNVTVEPRTINVNATITNNTVGNITLEVNVTDNETGVGVNGSVVVTLPNGTEVPVEVVNGTAVVVLDIPINETKDEPIQVRYPADGVNNETVVNTTNTLSMNKRESSVEAEVTSKVANKTEVTVTVRDPVTGEPITSGNVSVTIGDQEIGRLPVGPDGTVVIPVDIPTKGTVDLNVTYIGNENYTEFTKEITGVNIEGSLSEFNAEVTNTTQGNVTIKVDLVDPVTSEHLPVSSVNVTLPDGTTEEFPISDDGTITVPLGVGKQNITISYPGDDTYNATSIPVNVTVNPRETSVNATVTNKTAGNVTVKVNVTDATTGEAVQGGKVEITLNGEVIGTATLPDDLGEDGTVEIVTDINETGNYKLVAKYIGDENHTNESFNIESFDSTPKESKVTADIPNKTKGNTTVIVEVVDPVTGEGLNGTVIVTLPNGTNVPVVVTEGSGSMLLDLPVGDNTIVVKYPSNSKYGEDTIELPVKVEPRKINVETSITNSTQGNITLEVSVTDNETGMGVNGSVVVTLPNGTEVPVEVVNGTASVVLDIPISDTGNPVTVTYPADGENEKKVVTTEAISIIARESSVEAEVTSKVANKTEVTVTVRDPVTGEPITSGNVVVKLGDEIIGESEVGQDGQVIVPVNLPNKGNYDLTVTYEGNENYTGFTKEITGVNIEGSLSEFDAEVTNTTQGNVTIKVDLVDPVTGEHLPVSSVNVTLPDGTTEEFPISDDGTITVPLGVGKQNITISYPGDDTYNATSIPVNVTVNPRETQVEVTVTNATAGNTTVDVKVTDPVTGKAVTSGEVTLTVNGEEVGRLPVGPDGTVTIPTNITKSGSTSIVATYTGNENYAPKTVTANDVNIIPKESKLKANLTDTTQGETTLKVELTDPATGEGLNGKVTVNMPGSTPITVNVTKGIAEIPLDLPVGNTSIKLTYLGNTTYDSIVYELPVSVEKRPTTVTSNILSDVAGNVTVGVKVADQLTGKALNTGRVLVKDGDKVVGTAQLNEDGTATIHTDITRSDEYDLTIVYEGDINHEDKTAETDNIKVTPRQSEITADLTENNVGDTKVNVTITDPVTNTPLDGEVIITLPNGTNVTATAENGNIIVPVDMPAGDNDITVTYPGNETYDKVVIKVPVKINKRAINTEVTVLNSTVDDTKIQVKVTDEKTGQPVPGEKVTLTLPNGTTVNVTTNKDGIALISTPLSSGNNKLNVTVDGGDIHNSSTTIINTSVEKIGVKLVVDSVTGIVGETITLTAHITDVNGNPVNGGNIVFKLNGRTLRTDGRFDTNNTSPMKLSVKNGKVTFTMTADLYLRAGKNITASYSGSYRYESAKGNVAEANIGKRTATVTVNTNPKLVKQDKNIVFTATISDVTRGSKKSLVNSDDAYVIFKVNGKTLKDNKGNNIKVKVTNGMAKYTYHVPRGTSGMIDGHMRDYMVTAVYSNNDFYPDARDTVVYNVERSKTTINLTSVTVKDDKLSIKANILDQYGKNVIGNNQITIKINGKTFKVNGKTAVTVKDGKVNISGIKLNGNNVKTLTVVTGERQSYYESQVTTKNVKA